MTAFVLQQMDYVFFLYGLSFFLLGGCCFYISRTTKTSVAWRWLGMFGIFHGIDKWLDLAAVSFGDGPTSQTLRLLALTASFICLCEFGRRVTHRDPTVVEWPWIYMLLLVGVTVGCTWGVEGINATIRYSLGLGGGLWATLALYRVSKMPQEPAAKTMMAAAGCLALYMVLTGLLVPYASLFPANWLNQSLFLRTVGLPIQVIRAAVALALTACLWRCMMAYRAASTDGVGPQKPSPYIHILAGGIAAVALMGWFLTNSAGQRAADMSLEASAPFAGYAPRITGPLEDWQQEMAENRFVVIASTGIIIFLLAGSLVSVQNFQDSNEEALASGRLYRTVVDNSPNCLQLLDQTGRCLTVNPKGLEKAGRTEREMLGMHYFDMWPPQIRADVKNAFAKALRGQQAEFEANYQRPDGKSIAWQVVLNPVKNSQGTTQRIVEIATDITDYRNTEAQLRRAKDTAEAATLAKTAFLANMSHEIRTPITAVLGYAELLMEPQLNHEDQLAHLQTIRRNGETLLDLIDDVLDISKIEAGTLEVERTVCAPWPILMDVAASMQTRAATKGLTLSIEAEGPLPAIIHSDPGRLRQILANLVGNAVKFTEAGEVRVVARLLQGRRRDDSLLQCDVVDTGIGMTAAQLERVFEPFTQADSSSRRKYGGTGLGLTISKRLASALGGDITAVSTFGKGSTFQLTIATGPIDAASFVDPSKAVVAGAVSQRARPTLDCRILLAEDGIDNQRLLCLVLRKAGAEVAIAHNGREAVEMALTSFAGQGPRHDDTAPPFDVILMDIQMPVMDGFEATQRLRQGGYTGPIIALSAHATTQAAHQCLDAGCDDYLAKPIQRDELLWKIAQYVGDSQQKRERDRGPAKEQPGKASPASSDAKGPVPLPIATVVDSPVASS